MYIVFPIILFVLFEFATCNLWPKGIVHYSINPKHYDPHSQDVLMETFRKIQNEVCVKFFSTPANDSAEGQRVLHIHNANKQKLCPPRSYDFSQTVIDMPIGYKCLNERDIARIIVDMLKASINKTANTVNSQDLLKKFQEKGEDPNRKSLLNSKDRNYINENYFEECGGLIQRTVPSRRLAEESLLYGFSSANWKYYKNKVWPFGIVVYKVNYKLRDSADFDLVSRAMRKIEMERTGVMFQEAAQNGVLDARNMVVFDQDGADWPALGFQEGIQTLKLSSIARCEDPGHKSHALMMMLRILGIPMMSNRFDRDNYIKIHWKYVQKGQELYLEKTPEAAWLKFIPYDFESVTHAPANFLCPGCVAIYTVEPVQDYLWQRTLKMGHYTNLSPSDVHLINVVYYHEGMSRTIPMPLPSVADEDDTEKGDAEEGDGNAEGGGEAEEGDGPAKGEPENGDGQSVPEDNSHYVEGKSRYIWMPDGNNKLHLVDLEAPVPAAMEEITPQNTYWLYTRKNPDDPQLLVYKDVENVTNSNYDPKKPLIIIVHGWQSNRDSDVNVVVKEAFFAVEDVNVIVVDWSKKAAKLYVGAMASVARVGRNLGTFITWLVETTGGDWNKMHLIGFSLGAHVVGKAGKVAEGKPARVTVLDPAGPLWDVDTTAEIIRSSGQYVEAIHTNGAMLGMFANVAHTDFYPNGGKRQPGLGISASHSRAYELFGASLRHSIVGHACSDILQAAQLKCTGNDFDLGNALLTKRGKGIFGMETKNEFPFESI